LRLAGRLQHNGSVNRVAIVAAVVGALPGCFYYESINQRPAVQIENLSSDSLSPGDTAMLRAVMEDPDGDFVKLRWRAYACTDAEKFETYPEDVGCDVTPFFEKSDIDVAFDLPALRTFIDSESQALSAESALVILEATDELGATARPRAELIIPIVNKSPTLILSKQSTYAFVAGTPVRVIAKVGDDDDGPSRVTLTWSADPPLGTGFVAELVDDDPALISDAGDPMHLQHAKVFTADDPGEWTVRVKAADPLDNITNGEITINVIPDQAPCIAQLAPAVPPAGVAMPMSSPTLFRVPVVRDDLDRYPLVPNDEIFGATKFRWSVKNPGASSHVVVVGASGNSFALDPASYTPGDLLSVRVEIFDRKNTPIPCPDGDATCSTISEPTCLQRQTWRVEVR
jgi:hypothetical protein